MAYPGAVVIVGTDLAGTIVILSVQEKDRVRGGSGDLAKIPDAVVGRRLAAQDPGKPEDTRVLVVRVALLEPTPLKLGQRVEIRID